MGNAADAHDINIQYCLTLTRHGLSTLEIPRVTMARASADYAYNFIQWTIGITGMLTDSIGLAPHKDTFYTVPEMPDNGHVLLVNYTFILFYTVLLKQLLVKQTKVSDGRSVIPIFTAPWQPSPLGQLRLATNPAGRIAIY